MKRPLDTDGNRPAGDDEKAKKKKGKEEEGTGFVHLDEDLLFEILKHVDARSLATAACVSKQWYKTAQDERLWEMICTRNAANIGCGPQQLRSVVLALGGFRRLHSEYLWKVSSSSSSTKITTSLPSTRPRPMIPSRTQTQWGKDEVYLSLSLLSIRYYEMMNFNKKGS